MAKWKDKDEELPFAEGLSSLGNALSAEHERETPLETAAGMARDLGSIYNTTEKWKKIRIAATDKKLMALGEPLFLSDKTSISETDLENFDKIDVASFSPGSDLLRTITNASNSIDPKNTQQAIENRNFNVNMGSLGNIIGDTRFEEFFGFKYQKAIMDSGDTKEEPDIPKPDIPTPESTGQKRAKAFQDLGGALSEKPEDKTTLGTISDYVKGALGVQEALENPEELLGDIFKRLVGEKNEHWLDLFRKRGK